MWPSINFIVIYILKNILLKSLRIYDVNIHTLSWIVQRL